ncbi:MAG: preprotein translocase subunit SecY [Anaerolineae bacterium]|nr:preprotein translocase subunit SecY [Anaerolineae bacterium]MDH7473505.1 preprotein translocase subunit SecY [Anaerolineae bacterium]
MIQAVRNAFGLPDLRRKMLITFLILVIYRLAAHVPVPNIKAELLSEVFSKNQLLSLLDMFSGGAMSNFSVMAMGVYPYVTAQIVIQLLQPIIPALEELAKEGEAGRNKLNQYTYLLTIPLCALQAFSLGMQMQYQGVITNFGLTGSAWLPTLTTILTMTAGTMFAIWLGELITEQGIGQGLSIIILGGIVARIPQRVGAMITTDLRGLIAFLIITAVTVLVIVIVQEGQRRIPVQYGKRVLAMRGNRLRIAGGQSTHIPLRVNSAGMIPLIFAQSFMMLPGVIASYFTNSGVSWVKTVATSIYNLFNGQSTFYWIMYFVLVIGFTYFYTSIVFQQQNLAENLKKQGGFIPGIRPGKRTEDYLNEVLGRITLVGAIFLGVVAILPWMVQDVTETSTMLITSTGLLIVVGVVLDTMRQLEAQLLMRHYEGFIK